MATVQQLEKLVHIQKMFAVEDSLEAAVTMERLESLINKTEQILRQRTFLREERRLLRMSTGKVERYIDALEIVRKPAWVNPSMVENNAPDKKRVMINVGGLMFETMEETILKEEDSLLAQLCGPNPPVEPDHEGFFYFDRDWWLFRYILMFLRDGQLPSDHRLLAKLYREATFWRLPALQLAIEEEKLNLRREKTEEEKEMARKWWTRTPSWWTLERTEPPPEPPEDWWVDDVYQGKSFRVDDMPEIYDMTYKAWNYQPDGYRDPLYHPHERQNAEHFRYEQELLNHANHQYRTGDPNSGSSIQFRGGAVSSTQPLAGHSQSQNGVLGAPYRDPHDFRNSVDRLRESVRTYNAAAEDGLHYRDPDYEKHAQAARAKARRDQARYGIPTPAGAPNGWGGFDTMDQHKQELLSSKTGRALGYRSETIPDDELLYRSRKDIRYRSPTRYRSPAPGGGLRHRTLEQKERDADYRQGMNFAYEDSWKYKSNAELELSSEAAKELGYNGGTPYGGLGGYRSSDYKGMAHRNSSDGIMHSHYPHRGLTAGSPSASFDPYTSNPHGHHPSYGGPNGFPPNPYGATPYAANPYAEGAGYGHRHPMPGGYPRSGSRDLHYHPGRGRHNHPDDISARFQAATSDLGYHRGMETKAGAVDLLSGGSAHPTDRSKDYKALGLGGGGGGGEDGHGSGGGGEKGRGRAGEIDKDSSPLRGETISKHKNGRNDSSSSRSDTKKSESSVPAEEESASSRKSVQEVSWESARGGSNLRIGSGAEGGRAGKEKWVDFGMA